MHWPESQFLKPLGQWKFSVVSSAQKKVEPTVEPTKVAKQLIFEQQPAGKTYRISFHLTCQSSGPLNRSEVLQKNVIKTQKWVSIYAVEINEKQNTACNTLAIVALEVVAFTRRSLWRGEHIGRRETLESGVSK